MKHTDLNALQGINNDDAGATQAAPNGNGGAQATPVLAQPAAAAPQARVRPDSCDRSHGRGAGADGLPDPVDP
ncbi:MAG: hypothetical protein UY91_C0042G0002 [Parcubacteria group bacterium GW2011_GWB1_55_9]|nr:MAG: hypothetical protein UY91_C0042G0002 [Parcubacteria group bacterium GW2011_GWB1_55_9]